MSERVRMARALDAVERVVDRCCDMAAAEVHDGAHLQNEMKFDIAGAVADAAEIYSVDSVELKREAMAMLRNGLNNTLRPICEVRYVKPLTKGGEMVGMTVRFYVWPSHMRRSA